MRKTTWMLLGGTIILLVACSSEVIGPSQVTLDGLRLDLELNRASVERQESLVATVRIENLNEQPVELVSSCTALTLIKTFRGGDRVDLVGTVLGCGDAITPFVIEGGATLTESFEIRAVRQGGQPVEKGRYVLRAEFMVVELPDLEVSFRVE